MIGFFGFSIYLAIVCATILIIADGLRNNPRRKLEELYQKKIQQSKDRKNNDVAESVRISQEARDILKMIRRYDDYENSVYSKEWKI